MSKDLLRSVHGFLLFRTPLMELYTKFCDVNHHLKYSFKERALKNDKSHLKYYLTKHYHIIEKGLALPTPRLGFGQPKILAVIEKATKYEQLYGTDDMILAIRNTLVEYLKFNELHHHVLPQSFTSVINNFLNGQATSTLGGGLKYIEKELASSLSLQDFDEFTRSRVSVRDFSGEAVQDEVLYSAVAAAKNAPSVCNRQGWKVHYYNDKSRIKELLSYQNGNTGFTDSIDKLIIVTADAKAFTVYESNQVFIDGGLFSMNLLLAIHAAGLGACPLNTCYPYYKEKKVKRVGQIPEHERLIMMIGVGSLKENYTVAYSQRNPTEDIFVAH